MGRVSNKQAQEHREQVVSTAARLFRERGVQGVSVADLMGEVGLTHGGFYRQFASKDALLAEATERAFEGMTGLLQAFDAQHPEDHDAARRDLIDYYLSPEHRENIGEGCPSAGLGGDLIREEAGSAARIPYVAGVQQFADWISGDANGQPDLATVCTLVGALVLSRATAGSGLSDEILAAAHAALAESER